MKTRKKLVETRINSSKTVENSEITSRKSYKLGKNSKGEKELKLLIKNKIQTSTKIGLNQLRKNRSKPKIAYKNSKIDRC